MAFFWMAFFYVDGMTERLSFGEDRARRTTTTQKKTLPFSEQ